MLLPRAAHRLTACVLVLLVSAPSPVHAEDEQHTSTRHAWGTFFGHTGALAGVAISAAVFAADPPGDDEFAVLQAVPILGGLSSTIGLAAAEGRWDPHLGWALSGAYGGALVGGAFGLAGAILEGQQLGDAGLLEAAVVSSLLGAVAIALGVGLESLDGGHPAALLGGLHAGFATGLAAGLIAMSVSDAPEARAAPLISAGAGALMGLVVTEAVRQSTR